MTATGIISALLIGLVIGTLGRLLLPGKQSIGIIATAAVGVGAALLGTFVARQFNLDDNATARWNGIGLRLRWSWVELAIQLGFAVIGIALAAALSNTVIANGYRDRRKRRRTRAH